MEPFNAFVETKFLLPVQTKNSKSVVVWSVSTKYTLVEIGYYNLCLLYTSDAADERSSVDLGGRRIIKKKTHLLWRGPPRPPEL